MVDKAVFGNYVIAHSENLQRFIYTLTSDNYAKDEILQNTIIRAYKSFDGLKEHEKFYGWIMQIARRETIRYFHAEKKWQECCEFDETVAENVTCPDSGYIEIANKEFKEVFWKVVDSIKREHAQILILHFKYNLSLKDVSESLGKNYNTIKSQYRRGLEEAKASYFEITGDKEGDSWLITK